MFDLVKLVVGIAMIVAVIQIWFYLLVFVVGLLALWFGLVIIYYIILFVLTRLEAVVMILNKKRSK